MYIKSVCQRLSMQNFIVQQGIIQNFLLEKPYLPSGTCSYCRSKVNKFLKTGTPVNVNPAKDYLSIIRELRNLPIETRDSKSKLHCDCQVCQIARLNCTNRKGSQISGDDSSLKAKGIVQTKCPKCFSIIGPGHHHSQSSCKSSSTIVKNLEKELPPHISQQLASRFIDKAPKNSAGQSILSTAGGKPKLVTVGPVPDDPVQISHETFFKMERELGLSRNQINGVLF